MMNNEPFVIERILNAPVEKVWGAITDAAQMKEWYFDLPGFKAEAGYEFQFEGGDPAGKMYLHICKVTEVVLHQKLSYTWRYHGYEGDSLVSFELFAAGSSTSIKLTHAGLETFPASNPDLAKENFAAGWTDIIGRSLAEFVQKQGL
jgi:uncharacterized protein YndB with AHSA1/START domain